VLLGGEKMTGYEGKAASRPVRGPCCPAGNSGHPRGRTSSDAKDGDEFQIVPIDVPAGNAKRLPMIPCESGLQ
jgi:hypothetical protein